MPPVDLSLSLGEVVVRVDGEAVSIDPETIKKFDDTFVMNATDIGAVRSVLPRGSATDIYYDMDTDLEVFSGQSVPRRVYQIVAFLPAALIPGFPYPWQVHRREQVRIRAGSGTTAVTIRQYTMAYTTSLWGGTIWAPIVSEEELQKADGEYIVATFSEAVQKDHGFFEQYAATLRGSDTQVDEVDSQEDAQPSQASIVRIETPQGVGSGFFVTERLIATNAHVVGDAQRVSVKFNTGEVISGRVEFSDETLDFALIHSPVRSEPLHVRQTPLIDGESILALGFPQGRKVMAVSTGTVRGITECCVIHDALIAAGSSGGPLLDARQEVVGVNTFLHKKKGDRLNDSDRALALKMSFILEQTGQNDE